MESIAERIKTIEKSKKVASKKMSAAPIIFLTKEESAARKKEYDELSKHDDTNKFVYYKLIPNLSLEMLDKLENLHEQVCNLLEEVYVHPVSLELVWGKCTEKNLNWDTVLFEQTMVEVFSMSNGNDSDDGHEGGSCKYLELPVDDFKYQIDNKKGITIKNIVEAVYRVKGSKYDLEHEIFDGLCLTKMTSKKLTFEASFVFD